MRVDVWNRLLQQQQRGEAPAKIIIYIFMLFILLGMCFFVYNWWRCRQNRVLENEMEEYDFEQEVEEESKDGIQTGNFKAANIYAGAKEL